MALTFLVMLATAHLEDADFVVLAMRHDCDTHCCAGHQGRTNLDISAVSDGQHLVNHDFLAYVRSNLFYFNFFASSNTILFAAGFYDRVHVNLFRYQCQQREAPLSRDILNIDRLWERIFAEPASITFFGICRSFYPGESRSATALSIIRGNSRTSQPHLLSAFLTLQATPTQQANPLAVVTSEMLEVDKIIAGRLESSVPLVGQVSRYIISAGGKRLRPVLLLLCAGALGCKSRQRFTLAGVVEFIHTATLLHDDVVDESVLRRGNATANEAFGNPASVLVGDFLYSRAFQMMVEAGDMRIMKVLADATNVIAEGEVMQLMNMHNAALDEAGYLQVIRSKTAKLFEASARVGAILANADPETEAACSDYGQALGTAFQVIDDVLDYAGDTTVMGKNLGDDLREGKATLPLISAMQRGTPAQSKLIRLAIENGSIDLLGEVASIVKSTGALDVARAAAGREALRAVSAARLLPVNAYSACLIELAAQLLERDH